MKDKVIKNKKATFNFEVLEKLEAGVELFGFEVKSLRLGDASLDGSYVIIKGGEVFLKNAFIAPYQEKNTPESYDPRRLRKLLLHRSQISDLLEKKKGSSLTFIPLMWYNKKRKIKLEIAIARGKKKHDKRETIKRRDQERDVGRRLK
jgi:SsrA-binding protein